MYVVIMCLETLRCYIMLIYHFIYLITFDIQRVRKKMQTDKNENLY